MPCFSFCLPPCSRWIFVNSSLWSSRTSPFKWFTSQLSSTGEACGQWIGAFGRQAWPHTATDHRCCKYNSACLLVEHFPLRMLVLSLNLVLFYSVQKKQDEKNQQLISNIWLTLVSDDDDLMCNDTIRTLRKERTQIKLKPEQSKQEQGPWNPCSFVSLDSVASLNGVIILQSHTHSNTNPVIMMAIEKTINLNTKHIRMSRTIEKTRRDQGRIQRKWSASPRIRLCFVSLWPLFTHQIPGPKQWALEKPVHCDCSFV